MYLWITLQIFCYGHKITKLFIIYCRLGRYLYVEFNGTLYEKYFWYIIGILMYIGFIVVEQNAIWYTFRSKLKNRYYGWQYFDYSTCYMWYDIIIIWTYPQSYSRVCELERRPSMYITRASYEYNITIIKYVELQLFYDHFSSYITYH